jgi:hypothetical protein
LFYLFLGKVSRTTKASQQSVHLTLGILRQSQAVFYALAFFQLDGFAVPAPAQVTQAVGRLKRIKHEYLYSGVANVKYNRRKNQGLKSTKTRSKIGIQPSDHRID